MGINNSNGSFSKNNNNRSYQRAKRVLPRIQSVPKGSNPYSHLKDGLRSHEGGLDHIHIKKAAAVFPVSEIKDIDFKRQLNFTEGLSDESDCLWLSSDCKSSSLLSSDDSQDDWELDCWDTSLHDRFSSLLSLSGASGVFLDKNSGVSIFDGSRISPIDEASLILDRPCEGIDQKHLQEKVVIWLHNTDGNEVTYSSLGCSESGDSSYETSLFEDSSMFESSCTSLSMHDGSPSYVQDFDRTDIQFSLLDLEGEDSELVQDREVGFDVFGSDFPSPPFNARRNLLIRSPDSSSITSFGQTEEANRPSENSAADEPLFWPFDHNSYWHPELDQNFLCISPCRDGRNLGIQGINGSKSTRLSLHQKNNPPVGSKNMQGCRRRIVFSSAPESAPVDCRTRGLNNNDVKKINTIPSRLSGLTQAPEQHPCNISMKRSSLPLKARRPRHIGNQQLLSKLELGASNVRNLLVEGVPIEEMVGLNEFDGHEGINVEFGEDQFTLHGSPYDKAYPSREIEKLVGLNEFDGHEGINVEFDDDHFTLHGSPCKQAFSLREIENSVGLDEFNGHEGINVEFDDEQFTLDRPPCKQAFSMREIEKLVGLNEFDGQEGINMEFDDNQFTLLGSSYIKAFSVGEIERSTGNSDQKGCGHATPGSCQSNLFMDDCCKTCAKGHQNLIDVQSTELHSHGLKLSEKEGD